MEGSLMPLDIKVEINKIKAHYESDPLQQRFSALVTGESGSGKTFLCRTARRPIHIDSFDPGGTKCIRDLIARGHAVADTRWEAEDPFIPSQFGEWMRTVDERIKSGYFEHFGTYVLDSASSWGDSVMNYQLKGANRAGEAPKFTKDYTPQKVWMINYIKKLMTIPCDFILTGHLKMIEETVGKTKDGDEIKRIKYRFLTTGQAMVTIPMQFDELYVIVGKETSSGIVRKLLTDAQGTYMARSRLRADGKLDAEEEPDIKKMLKKIGIKWEDKPKLEF
jgi:hypothetical protein